MATHLTLLCIGATASSRVGAFGSPAESLDEAGRKKAATFQAESYDRIIASSALSARETAEAAGIAAITDKRLDDIDHGLWAGKSIHELEAASPARLAEWLVAPWDGAPEGEPISAVVARIGDWMGEAAKADGRWLAVTHPMTIRAALMRATGFAADAAFAIDIAPLSSTVLSYNGRWRLQELRRF